MTRGVDMTPQKMRYRGSRRHVIVFQSGWLGSGRELDTSLSPRKLMSASVLPLTNGTHCLNGMVLFALFRGDGEPASSGACPNWIDTPALTLTKAYGSWTRVRSEPFLPVPSINYRLTIRISTGSLAL